MLYKVAENQRRFWLGGAAHEIVRAEARKLCFGKAESETLWRLMFPLVMINAYICSGEI